MVWYRELSVEVTKDSPLSETTGVDERKPTSRNKGMRRPDDHEANGSGPLQSQLAAGILLGILAFVLAILLRSGAPANLVHEVFSIDGATVNPYANISTNFDEQKIVKLSDSRLPRSRLEQMRAPSLHAGVFNSLWPGDMAQPLDNALTHEMGTPMRRRRRSTSSNSELPDSSPSKLSRTSSPLKMPVVRGVSTCSPSPCAVHATPAALPASPHAGQRAPCVVKLPRTTPPPPPPLPSRHPLTPSLSRSRRARAPS